MNIKFLAKTLNHYKGHDGTGGVVDMKKNDIAIVTEDIAKLLLQHYGADFEIMIEPKIMHAPKLDKQAKKTVSFKSK